MQKMEFLGMAVFISLMTFSTLGNAQETQWQPLGGGTCLPDVSCTLTLHYINLGDTPCTSTALRDPRLTRNKPVITWNDGTAVSDLETYILIMADPDAPEPCTSSGFRFKWAVEATFDTETKRLKYAATDLLPYHGPTPSGSSDAHRYQVMVYKVKKTAIETARAPFTQYGARRGSGFPLSSFMSALGLKNDEPPLASYQFCFSNKQDSGTCRTPSGASTIMHGGDPPQTTTTTPTITKPPSAESTTVKSVFQKTTLVLVYSVVLGWMNS